MSVWSSVCVQGVVFVSVGSSVCECSEQCLCVQEVVFVCVGSSVCVWDYKAKTMNPLDPQTSLSSLIQILGWEPTFAWKSKYFLNKSNNLTKNFYNSHRSQVAYISRAGSILKCHNTLAFDFISPTHLCFFEQRLLLKWTVKGKKRGYRMKPENLRF